MKHGTPPPQAEIMDNLKVICQCKSIKKAAFKKLIAEGAGTPEKLRKATGAGTGQCGGKRCGPRLRDMLDPGHNK